MTLIPEEDYTPELALRLREKYWGKQDPDEIILVEGVDEIFFDEDETEESRGFGIDPKAAVDTVIQEIKEIESREMLSEDDIEITEDK
jgi:hypothetical protein